MIFGGPFLSRPLCFIAENIFLESSQCKSECLLACLCVCVCVRACPNQPTEFLQNSARWQNSASLSFETVPWQQSARFPVSQGAAKGGGNKRGFGRTPTLQGGVLGTFWKLPSQNPF